MGLDQPTRGVAYGNETPATTADPRGAGPSTEPVDWKLRHLLSMRRDVRRYPQPPGEVPMPALHPTIRTTISGDAKVKEKDFQRLVIDLAHAFGWRVAHFRPAMTAHGWATPVAADGKGFPDLVLVHPTSGILYVELKVGTNLPSDEQLDWLEAIAVAGGVARVWTWPGDWPVIRRTLSHGRLT